MIIDDLLIMVNDLLFLLEGGTRKFLIIFVLFYLVSQLSLHICLDIANHHLIKVFDCYWLKDLK